MKTYLLVCFSIIVILDIGLAQESENGETPKTQEESQFSEAISEAEEKSASSIQSGICIPGLNDDCVTLFESAPAGTYQVIELSSRIVSIISKYMRENVRVEIYKNPANFFDPSSPHYERKIEETLPHFFQNRLSEREFFNLLKTANRTESTRKTLFDCLEEARRHIVDSEEARRIRNDPNIGCSDPLYRFVIEDWPENDPIWPHLNEREAKIKFIKFLLANDPTNAFEYCDSPPSPFVCRHFARWMFLKYTDEPKLYRKGRKPIYQVGAAPRKLRIPLFEVTIDAIQPPRHAVNAVYLGGERGRAESYYFFEPQTDEELLPEYLYNDFGPSLVDFSIPKKHLDEESLVEEASITFFLRKGRAEGSRIEFLPTFRIGHPGLTRALHAHDLRTIFYNLNSQYHPEYNPKIWDFIKSSPDYTEKEIKLLNDMTQYKEEIKSHGANYLTGHKLEEFEVFNCLKEKYDINKYVVKPTLESELKDAQEALKTHFPDDYSLDKWNAYVSSLKNTIATYKQNHQEYFVEGE